MKKLAEFGLEKIHAEALLSMARQENGALNAYIIELEALLKENGIAYASARQLSLETMK